MESSKEAISVRLARINAQLLGKNSTAKNPLQRLSNEGLLDALTVLYEECSSDYLKQNDKNMALFSERYKSALLELKKLRVNISDFEIKNVIGRGHFGEVFVVREKQTGDVFAMKSIKKSDCLQQNSATYEEERNIMALSDSPWLTTLQYAFQDSAQLYFVMEFHPGGDLYGLLERQGGTLPESAASFYISEIVLALNDLHTMGYVHRDVKPDNILLDRCGHLKLADFGSAARLNNNGVVNDLMPVGTPDYIAPEVLQAMENKKNTYGTSCDYWSLGILAYEMTVGTPPFSGNSLGTTYSRIMDQKTSIKFPPDITLSQAYINIVKGLLAPVNIRLSYRKIIDHPLFRSIDWSGLRDQVPPYVPHINAVDDTSNFLDVKPKKNEPNIANFKTKTQFSSRNLPFIGFTFTHNIIKDNVCIRKKEVQDERKIEIESLQKKLFKAEGSLKEVEDLEKKLEEKQRKLESAETIREKLERDLASNIAEVTSVKRVLELEKKERADLERKALELIKSAKQKWETAEKTKTDMLNKEIYGLNEKCANLITDNKILKEQLQQALNKQQDTHKESLQKVRSLNRQSVVGLESRLERVTSETQTQLCELQKQLSAETQKSRQLQSELEEKCKLELDFKEKLELFKEDVDSYKKKLGESLKIHREQENKILSLEKQCKDIRKATDMKMTMDDTTYNKKLDNINDLLRKEKNGNLDLKKQLTILENKLQETLQNNDILIQTNTTNYQKEIQQLQADLRKGSAERESLKTQLEVARESDANNKVKIDALEKLLQRLESGVAKLEYSGEREQVLQEQVERLEQQIIQVREDTAVERKELSTLKTKLWKMEKDLSNADLDKRIVERELKESEDKVKQLSTELEKSKHCIESEKETNGKVVTELASLNESLAGEVDKLKVIECSLQEQLKFCQTSLEEEKQRFSDVRKELQQKDVTIGALQNQLQNKDIASSNLEQKMRAVIEGNETLVRKLQEVIKDKAEIELELENYKMKLSTNELNLTALRDTCSLLEKQLEEYERIHDETKLKLDAGEEIMSTINNELAQSRIETLDARRMMNEEKSLKLLMETKCKRMEEDNELLKKECAAYKEQCTEYKNYSGQLSEELSYAEEKIGDLEVTIKSYERQLEGLMEDCLSAKEESSTRLTKVMALKESNSKLSHLQSEVKSENAKLLERIVELENNLEATESLYRDRELKFEGIEHQQRKLIHYLQTKIEENGKKKKTLTEKLFGSSKTTTPQPYPIGKDMESAFREEREVNKKLRSELELLKATSMSKISNGHSHSTISVTESKPIEPLKTEVKLCGNGNYTNTIKEIQNENLPIVHEGWIKTPNSTKTGWDSKYAKLSSKWLNIYSNPGESLPTTSLNLFPSEGYGRFVTEPLDNTAPLANKLDKDLVLVIEIYMSCWPPERFTLMALSKEDKETWRKSLENVLLQADQPYKGHPVLSLTESLDVNCFSGDPKLLGTEQGLYSWRNDRELLFIEGLRKVYQITTIPAENLVLMIAESNRILVQCDLNLLNSLALTKQFSHPSLSYEAISVSDLDGFHMFRCSDFKERQFVCAATAKQVVILRYNVLDRDFRPLRILDTAEPTSCIFFAQHSLIVGANKFFEVDLITFQADEFLDVCDEKLSQVVCCYKRNSFPLAIVETGRNPVEFLLCFNEFGVFADEFGRCCRDLTLQWSRLPLSFVYYAPYLYVVQFNGVEVIKIEPVKSEDERFESQESLATPDSFKLELPSPRFLGAYKKGIVVAVNDELILIEGRFLDKDNISLSSTESSATTTQQEQFSFTTSMVDSLDGHGTTGSDTETDVDFRKKVKFTDL